MEIDITEFFNNSEPFEFSASVMERGKNAGAETWRNACDEGERAPLLTTPEQLEALRDHMRGYGAWSREEINAWSSTECNALFIQLISGDMREAGMDKQFPDEFDWAQYESRSNAGEIAGRIFKGDDDRAFYYLGD